MLPRGSVPGRAARARDVTETELLADLGYAGAAISLTGTGGSGGGSRPIA